MRTTRQNSKRNNLQSRTKQLYLSLNNNKARVYMILSFMVFFLLLSYTFMMFSSVSHSYSLSYNKEQLSKITTANSTLSSEYLNKKDEVIKEDDIDRVAVGTVSYVRSGDIRFAYNK